MSRYDIDPAGVERVLRSTQTKAGEFETILKPLQGWVEFAATGTGNSGAIVPALQSFFQVQSTGLEAMGRRISAALQGAVSATTAYVQGDLEMVQTYQSNAATLAAGPPPAPSRRYGGGLTAE
jgi:Family of unknown function (DUF6507)